MSSFEIGDQVRMNSPKARVDRGAVFVITELKLFDDQLCATGDGHAWWPVEMLDFNITDEQRSAMTKLEMAFHAVYESREQADKALIEAEKLLPGRLIERVKKVFWQL